MLGVGSDTQVIPRVPLNIGLVLDRSGSMDGDKLHKALESAMMIAGMLHSHEYLSIAAFDSEPLLVLPATCGPEAAIVQKALSTVTAGSNTNMGSGYTMAHKEVEGCMGNNVSRLILLSDGLVNEGMGQQELIRLAEAWRKQRITTSSFGVGSDFDEELMTSIAENGGGMAYFIDQPSDSVAVFGEELDTLRSLVASRCELSFDSSLSGIKVTQLNSYLVTGESSWILGDISAKEERNLVLELELPAIQQTGTCRIGTVKLNWEEFSGGGVMQENMLELPIEIQVVGLEQFNSIIPDDTVTIEAALLTIARAKRNAREMGIAHKYEEAANMLEQVAAQIEGLELESSQLAEELADIRERARRLRLERDAFLTASERKSMSYEANLFSKGRRSSYVSSKERYVRELMARKYGADHVMVSHTELSGRSGNLGLGSHIMANATTVERFLFELSLDMGDEAYSESYGINWILQDYTINRIFDMGPGWAKHNGATTDQRELSLAGIKPGMSLKALPIEPADAWTGTIPDNMIFLDLSAIIKSASEPIQETWDGGQPVCDFLAKIFYMISSVVPPSTYGGLWLLREQSCGRIFDIGSSWAKSMGTLADTRPISAVGINGGRMYQVVSLLPV